MKKLKTAAFLTAAILTGTALPSAVPAVQTAAEETAKPGWYPSDFDKAWSFYNRFGKTRIYGDQIYTVFREYQSDGTPASDLTLFSDDLLQCVVSELYEAPDKYPGECFRFSIYAPVKAGDAVIRRASGEPEDSCYDYTFHIDEALHVTETDLCGWAPDCWQEFWSQGEDTEKVVTHGRYIAFLTETTGGTGYSWIEGACDAGRAERIAAFDCTNLRLYANDAMRPSGGEICTAVIYEVKQDGPLELRLDHMPPGRDSEPADSLGGMFQVTDGCSLILKSGEARVQLFDADTGKPVIYPFTDGGSFYLDYLNGEQTEEYNVNVFPRFCKVSANPCKVPLGSLFRNPHYRIWMSNGGTPAGYSMDAMYQDGACSDDSITVERFTDDIADITVKVHFQADGDMNKDGAFSLADAVLMQRWMLNIPDTVLANWKAGDFVNDDKLDARDCSVMKQRLLARAAAETEQGCTLTVTTSYGGYGVAGQPLGSGSFETTFAVVKGDCFYEDDAGHWYQNICAGPFYEPILTVTDITDESVTVCGYSPSDGEKAELTLAFGEASPEYFPLSYNIVYDGINYTYSICFSKTETEN